MFDISGGSNLSREKQFLERVKEKILKAEDEKEFFQDKKFNEILSLLINLCGTSVNIGFMLMGEPASISIVIAAIFGSYGISNIHNIYLSDKMIQSIKNKQLKLVREFFYDSSSSCITGLSYVENDKAPKNELDSIYRIVDDAVIENLEKVNQSHQKIKA